MRSVRARSPVLRHAGVVFERFTAESRRVVVLAQEEVRLLQHDHIGPEHMLLGLVHEGEGVAGQALAAVGVTLEDARASVERILGRAGRPPGGHIPFTPGAKRVLELSLRQALELGHAFIGTEHLLLGLVRVEEEGGTTVLSALTVDPVELRTQVLRRLAEPTELVRLPPIVRLPQRIDERLERIEGVVLELRAQVDEVLRRLDRP